MSIVSSSTESKRLFAEQTDEINRRSRIEGCGAEAATDLAEILAEHERECEALLRRRSAVENEAAAR